MNIRSHAARIIDEVTQGSSLTACLDIYRHKIHSERDQAFLQALCYGVCRYYPYLDAVLSHLLEKPMKAKDSDVHAVLLIGLYQLTHMRVPPHAAVAETTNAVKQLKKPWATGLCNAVLREYLRRQTQIAEQLKEDEEAYYAHPQWWISYCKKSWPTHWRDILMANNVHPPLSLRVNQRISTRDAYLAQLTEQGIDAEPIAETTSGVILKQPMPAEKLPGLAAGLVSVQDGAAQLAAELLELAPQQIVLDACAAPGGKLTHILECQPNLTACVAVEKDSERLKRITENLLRTKTQAQCYCADVNDVAAWWNGQLFDRILLDAPCSASGVIRRHPDIKLLRQPNDIPAFAKEQQQLLETLWPLLKPGGLLVYATCSIFPEENVEVMMPFVAKHHDAKESIITATFGEPCRIGRQIFPGIMDGFYYARLQKI